jgi:hypothetical protein
MLLEGPLTGGRGRVADSSRQKTESPTETKVRYNEYQPADAVIYGITDRQ